MGVGPIVGVGVGVGVGEYGVGVGVGEYGVGVGVGDAGVGVGVTAVVGVGVGETVGPARALVAQRATTPSRAIPSKFRSVLVSEEQDLPLAIRLPRLRLMGKPPGTFA